MPPNEVAKVSANQRIFEVVGKPMECVADHCRHELEKVDGQGCFPGEIEANVPDSDCASPRLDKEHPAETIGVRGSPLVEYRAPESPAFRTGHRNRGSDSGLIPSLITFPGRLAVGRAEGGHEIGNRQAPSKSQEIEGTLKLRCPGNLIEELDDAARQVVAQQGLQQVVSGIHLTQPTRCHRWTWGVLWIGMTAMWEQRDGQWRLASPSSFPDEASLHDRIAEAPQLLPLAGSPRVTVLGREVRLGSGYADLIAVEASGRPVVVEVKLARNAEARRAVVAQILSYAAYLFGLTLEQFDRDVLGEHLRQQGFDSVPAAVMTDDQAGGFNRSEFEAALASNLSSGHFRLVLVLDEAPEELVALVGYLEAVTPELVIDLVTVSQYQIGESQLLVPQRIDPERKTIGERPVSRATDHGILTNGAKDFIDRIMSAPEPVRPQLERLANWAVALEQEGVVVSCYHGKNDILTLLPRLPIENVGLVTVWFDDRGGSIVFWRTVFERRAPESLPNVEAAAAPDKVTQNAVTRRITDNLLSALTQAYREALNSIRSP